MRAVLGCITGHEGCIFAQLLRVSVASAREKNRRSLRLAHVCCHDSSAKNCAFHTQPPQPLPVRLLHGTPTSQAAPHPSRLLLTPDQDATFPQKDHTGAAQIKHQVCCEESTCCINCVAELRNVLPQKAESTRSAPCCASWRLAGKSVCLIQRTQPMCAVRWSVDTSLSVVHVSWKLQE